MEGSVGLHYVGMRKALYGRKCRTPLCWDEEGERKFLGS